MLWKKILGEVISPKDMKKKDSMNETHNWSDKTNNHFAQTVKEQMVAEGQKNKSD
jgi:hypothetical protein